MTDVHAKEKYANFIRSKMTAVLATVSPTGQPMAATIYFDIDEAGNFYFMTKSFTRKQQNIQRNPMVALVIGADNEPVSAQIEGRAEKIIDQETFTQQLHLLEKRFFKNEYVAPLFQLSREKHDIVIYKIVPQWIRWLDQRDPNIDADFIQIV